MTKQRKIGESASGRDDYFRSLFEAMAAMIQEVDLQGRILRANPATVNRLGYSEEELVGRNISELFTSDSQELLSERFPVLLKEGELRLELDLVCKDGEVIPVDASASAVRDERGDISSIVFYQRNVTEKKRAEKELQEHMHILGERVKELSFLYEISRLSAEMEMPLDSIIQTTVNHLPTAMQWPDKACVRIVRKGREFTSEGFTTGLSKFSVDISVSGEVWGVLEVNYQGGSPEIIKIPFLDEERQMINTSCKLLESVIERRRAVDEVERQVAFSTRLLNAMYDGAEMIDRSGVLTYINPAFCRMTGYSADQLIGLTPPYPYWPEDEQHRIWKVFNRIVTEGKGAGHDFEVMFQRKNGERFFCQLTPAAVIEADGTVAGWMIVLKDITDRKHAEVAMKRRLMAFRIDDGQVYLVPERRPDLSLKAFDDLLKVGYRGLAISRRPETEFRRTIGGEFEYGWLAERGGAGSVKPDLDELDALIDSQPRGTAILIDRLDYLLLRNGFKATLAFVQRLRETAHLSGLVIILSMEPAAVDDRQLSLLEDEGEELHRLDRARIPDALYKLLNYIYRENMAGVKPSHSDVARDLGISKPTARKRIRQLVSHSYVTISPRGRFKTIELTDTGRLQFIER